MHLESYINNIINNLLLYFSIKKQLMNFVWLDVFFCFFPFNKQREKREEEVILFCFSIASNKEIAHNRQFREKKREREDILWIIILPSCQSPKLIVIHNKNIAYIIIFHSIFLWRIRPNYRIWMASVCLPSLSAAPPIIDNNTTPPPDFVQNPVSS